MHTRDRLLMIIGLWIAISPFLLILHTLYMLPANLPSYLEFQNVSKYNNLYVFLICLIPICAISAGAWLKSRKLAEKNFLYIIAFATIISLLTNGIIIFGLHEQMTKTQLLKSFDFIRLLSLSICIIFSIMGAFLPVLRFNQYLGLKNGKTMKSPLVWTIVHKNTALPMIIGFYMLGIGVSFLKNWISITAIAGGIITFFIATAIYSNIVYKKINSENTD